MCPSCGALAPTKVTTAEITCVECGRVWAPDDGPATQDRPAAQRVGPPPLPTTSATGSQPPPIPTSSNKTNTPDQDPTPERGRRGKRNRVELLVHGQFVFRCLACGHEFARGFKHQTSVSIEEADNDHLLKQTVQTETLQPRKLRCPECGARSPKEMGQARGTANTFFGILTTIAIGFLLAASLDRSNANGFTVLRTIIIALAIVQLVAALLATALFPARIQETDPDEDASQLTAAYPLSPRWPGYGLLALALLCFAMHPLWRMLYPLPHNPDCQPRVVVPGEKTRVQIPNTLKSFGDYWSGTARVFVKNGQEYDPPLNIIATTRKESQRITIDTPAASVGGKPNLYVDLTVANHPKLATTPIELEIELNVSYPQPIGDTRYVYADHVVTHSLALHIVQPGLSSRDWVIGLVSAGLGLLASVMGFVWLHRTNLQLQRITFPRKLEINEVRERVAKR